LVRRRCDNHSEVTTSRWVLGLQPDGLRAEETTLPRGCDTARGFGF